LFVVVGVVVVGVVVFFVRFSGFFVSVFSFDGLGLIPNVSVFEKTAWGIFEAVGNLWSAARSWSLRVSSAPMRTGILTQSPTAKRHDGRQEGTFTMTQDAKKRRRTMQSRHTTIQNFCIARRVSSVRCNLVTQRKKGQRKASRHHERVAADS
jgi:hypothetical protein